MDAAIGRMLIPVTCPLNCEEFEGAIPVIIRRTSFRRGSRSSLPLTLAGSGAFSAGSCASWRTMKTHMTGKLEASCAPPMALSSRPAQSLCCQFSAHELRLEPSQRLIMAHEQYPFALFHDGGGFAGFSCIGSRPEAPGQSLTHGNLTTLRKECYNANIVSFLPYDNHEVKSLGRI